MQTRPTYWFLPARYSRLNDGEVADDSTSQLRFQKKCGFLRKFVFFETTVEERMNESVSDRRSEAIEIEQEWDGG